MAGGHRPPAKGGVNHFFGPVKGVNRKKNRAGGPAARGQRGYANSSSGAANIIIIWVG